MDLKAFAVELNNFGRDYAGLVAVAAFAASVVVPIGWDLIKGLNAKVKKRPKPKTGRWAKALYRIGGRIGGWFRMIGKRLTTDSETLQNEKDALTATNAQLSNDLRTTKEELSRARTQASVLLASNEALENDLNDASAEVERLGKALLRARGTDHKANQEALEQLRKPPVPQPVWLIKKSVLTGYLDFNNVGGGNATSVRVDTNLPKDVTLVDAHFEAIDKGFRGRFAIEPHSMRENFDLEYHVSWVDEAGNHETITKRAAER